MKNTTLVNHPPAVAVPEDNRPLVAPIYQSVKFSFDDANETLRYQRGEREGFFYSRNSNPTLTQLQRLLGELQGRDDCLLTGSGVATIAASLLALCKAGDHVLLFIESYGPTRFIVQHLLAKFAVTHTMLSIEDLAGIEQLLKEKPTRVVVFESPTNPVTKIADIEHLTRHARAAGALTVLDNTFAGFHNHGAYDIDVYLHSLTKYASGHGDVMGGAIIARRELIAAMRKDIGAMGPALDPHAAFLIQRGMRTYFLRYERQCASAILLAEYLKQHPRVKRVHSGSREPPAARAGATANEGLRNRREHRTGWRLQRRRALCRIPGVVFNRGQRRLDRIVGHAAAAFVRRRLHPHAARQLAGWKGDGAPVDWSRGCGRPEG